MSFNFFDLELNEVHTLKGASVRLHHPPEL